MAHTRCMLDKQGYMHARTCVRARARTLTQVCNIYCFSTATMIHECAPLLRYTYIVFFRYGLDTQLVRFD
jgi:hypothetical protein